MKMENEIKLGRRTEMNMVRWARRLTFKDK